MFSENRSELAVPVVGFLLLGFATLFAAISIFNAKWDFFEGIGTIDPWAFRVLGLLLAVVAFFSLAKAYLIEGAAFGVFAVFLAVYSMVPTTDGIFQLAVLALGLAVVSVIIAMMSYRVGDLMVFLIAVLSLIAFVSVMFANDTESIAFVIAGVGLLAVAVVALISAVLEWLFVQDVAMDFADYMYGDGEECGCGCESEE